MVRAAVFSAVLGYLLWPCPPEFAALAGLGADASGAVLVGLAAVIASAILGVAAVFGGVGLASGAVLFRVLVCPSAVAVPFVGPVGFRRLGRILRFVFGGCRGSSRCGAAGASGVAGVGDSGAGALGAPGPCSSAPWSSAPWSSAPGPSWRPLPESPWSAAPWSSASWSSDFQPDRPLPTVSDESDDSSDRRLPRRRLPGRPAPGVSDCVGRPAPPCQRSRAGRRHG